MGSMAVEEVSPHLQEELCLLPAALLVAERRSNLAGRQHRLRKCVTNICESAPVHFKSFIRKRGGKSLKFAELTNSQRMTRSPSARSADRANVYDLSTTKRRSTLLYYV